MPRKMPLTFRAGLALGLALGSAGGAGLASRPLPTEGVCPPGWVVEELGRGLNRVQACAPEEADLDGLLNELEASVRELEDGGTP